MGAPKGSRNALKNKGGGRKSAYQEYSRAEALDHAFFEGISSGKLMELEEKLESKEYKGKIRLYEYMLLRAFRSDRILSDLIRRVFPDTYREPAEPNGLVDALRAIAEGRIKPQLQEKPKI